MESSHLPPEKAQVKGGRRCKPREAVLAFTRDRYEVKTLANSCMEDFNRIPMSLKEE